MADFTECPVCFDEYKDPKLLPCNHTLCLNCLEKLTQKGMKGIHLKCPICNTVHEVPERGVTSFSENQHVIELISKNKVGFACNNYGLMPCLNRTVKRQKII